MPPKKNLEKAEADEAGIIKTIDIKTKTIRGSLVVAVPENP
jgi:hypothetical protein